MIVSHNIIALNAYNKLQTNGHKNFEIIRKLSSGMRINSASDDSAGLAISEKMRAQIRGLNMAEKNVQDGISLIQTAEGGLSNILEPPLQRMRELAVQAANGTLTYQEREMIQHEIEEIKQSINRISGNTHFNGIKLLDGNLKNEALNSGNLSSPVAKTPLAYEWDINFDAPKAIYAIDSTKDGGFIIGGTTNINAGFNEKSWVVKINSEGEVEWETTIPQKYDLNVVFDIKELRNGGFILSTRAFDEDYHNHVPILYILDVNGDIVEDKEEIGYGGQIYSINETKNGSFISTGTTTGGQGIIRLFDSQLNIKEIVYFDRPPESHHKSGLDVKETSDGGYIIVGVESHPDMNRKGFAIKMDSNFNVEWEAKIDNEDFQSVLEDEEGNYIILGRKSLYKLNSEGQSEIINADIGHHVSIGLGTTRNQNYLTRTKDKNILIGSTNKIYKVDFNGDELWNIELDPSSKIRAVTQIKDGGYVAVNSLNSIIKYSSDMSDTPEENLKNENGGLILQVGANAEQQFRIFIEDVSTEALGLNDINMLTEEDAQNALSSIDYAISFVSSERSRLGAYQNVLEHISNNVSNSAYNLSNAESRIRDIDMARGVMEMVKNQILVQASQAMLVQGNQMPSTVLELLK